MQENQQIIVNHYCDLQGASYQRSVLQQLDSKYLRLKLLAAAINPSDLLTIRGTYQARLSLPFVAGYEAAAVIVAVGKQCDTSWQVGQRVMVIGKVGAWQHYRDIEPEYCYRLPADLSAEVAASSYINPLTAWVMLRHQLQLQPFSKIVLTAAASAIGKMLITLLNQQGIAPIVIVRQPESAKALHAYQLQQILISQQANFEQQLQILQDRVDIVLDCVGGELAYQLSHTLRQQGQYLLYGLLSGEAVPAKFWRRRPDIDFANFHLRQWLQQATYQQIDVALRQISQLLQQGLLHTQVAQRYHLSQIEQALSHAAKLQRDQKVILVA